MLVKQVTQICPYAPYSVSRTRSVGVSILCLNLNLLIWLEFQLRQDITKQLMVKDLAEALEPLIHQFTKTCSVWT